EIERDALEALARMPWPGNVRELRNVLERACSLWDGMRLTTDALRAVLPEIDRGAVLQASNGDAATAIDDVPRRFLPLPAGAPFADEPMQAGPAFVADAARAAQEAAASD